MAISVNWPTGLISIPKADLTLISGTLYELDTNTFRLALRALEDDEEGMPWPRTHSHSTQVTVAGITYARIVEIRNGYSVEFEDGQYSVRLTGSNNNIWDIENGILVQNQVQVIPTNSAGLIVVSTGSGLSAEQDAKLTAINGQLTNIEGSAGHAMMMRAMMASMCNKITMVDNGDGTYSMTLRDMADSKDRGTATGPMAGGRSSVSWDMT